MIVVVVVVVVGRNSRFGGSCIAEQSFWAGIIFAIKVGREADLFRSVDLSDRALLLRQFRRQDQGSDDHEQT